MPECKILTATFERTDNIWTQEKGKEKSSCNFEPEHASLQERVLWTLVMSEVGLNLNDMPSSPTCQKTMLPVTQNAHRSYRNNEQDKMRCTSLSF